MSNRSESRGRINCFSCSSSQRDKHVGFQSRRRVTLTASPHSKCWTDPSANTWRYFWRQTYLSRQNTHVYIYSVRLIKAIVHSVNTWQKRCYSNSSSDGPSRPHTTCCKSGLVAAFTFHPKAYKLLGWLSMTVEWYAHVPVTTIRSHPVCGSCWEKKWQQIYKQCNRGRRWSIWGWIRPCFLFLKWIFRWPCFILSVVGLKQRQGDRWNLNTGALWQQGEGET